MRANQRYDWSYLLLCPYLMVAIIPKVVQYFQHRYILPLMLAWVVIAFMARRCVRLPRQGLISLVCTFLFLGLYLGIAPLMWLFDHGESLNYGHFSDYILTAFPLIVFHLSVCNGRQRELRLLTIFAFVCIAVSALMTLFGGFDVEGGSRALTGALSDSADLELIGAAWDAGIGSFSHVYGMGLLVFPLLYLIRFMTFSMKVFLSLTSILILVTVYMAGYSILLIGMFVAGLLCLSARFGVKTSLLKIVGVALVAAVVIVVATPQVLRFVMDPLQRMGDMIGQMEYQGRIESIVDTIAGSQDSYASYRSGLYWMSWDTFLKNPYFGVGAYNYQNRVIADNIGGHSLVFDLLGMCGLFGLSVFILFFVFYFRYMRVMSSVGLGFKWWPACYIFIFSAGAIAFINPLGGPIVFIDLLFFIPAFVFFFKRKDAGMLVQRGNGYPGQIKMPEVHAPRGLSR